MKLSISNLIALSLLTLGGTLRADIVYSNFLDTPIATDYIGTDVTVGSGTLNLFFGGAGVANDANFQPFRTGTGGLDTMKSFAFGDSIGSSSVSLASAGGSGGSTDHLGTQFTVGTDGYLGFKLAGTNYGWMRGNFTYAAAGAVVKDWVYDNTTGAAIKAGLIQTDVTSGMLTTTTLNPVTTGDSYTLSSALTNGVATGYINSVLKIGAGTAVLSGTNTYTGTTTVNAGKLVVNGSTDGGSAVTVAAGVSTDTPVATLGGTGTIGGTVTLAGESTSGYKNGGILAPTASASGTKLSVTGATTFGTGSIFEFDLNAATTDTRTGETYGQLAGTGTIGGTDAVFKIVLGSNAFTDTFWDTNKTWSDVFTQNSGTKNPLASIFTSFSGTDVLSDGTVTAQGKFTFNGGTTSTLTWSAVPEPTSALAGLLITVGLLRRRRA